MVPKKAGENGSQTPLCNFYIYTGEYVIPPVVVKYIGEKGEAKQISSNKISIFVESVKSKPSDKDDIRDIKSPLYLSHSFWFYFLLILFPLLMIGAG